MNLTLSFSEAARWHCSVLAQLLRVARVTSLIVIFYAVVARMTRILAFLLPLKIILLAGSEGVPRYFQFIVPLDRKLEGVVALSLAAIGFYALTLMLEARIKRLSQKGGEALLDASGLMAVVGNQNAQAQGIYADFTQVAADTLFAAVGLALLTTMTPTLGAYLLLAFSCCYLLSATALRGVTMVRRNRLANYIITATPSYLSILSSVVFLTSFLVILYPFVTQGDANILIAIICVVGLRRVLSAISDCIRLCISLSRQKLLINAMVFPTHQFQVLENVDQRTLRELFGRGQREIKFREDFSKVLSADESVTTQWLDPPNRTMAMFAVTATNPEGRQRRFQQRVYPERLAHLAANEELLFQHIPRDLVWAPPLISQFTYGTYSIIVTEAGTGLPPKFSEWSQIEAQFLTDLWSVEIPEELLSTYSASHRFLHQRLTRDFIKRLDIAINDDHQAKQFEIFINALPRLRSSIALLPLRLVNSAFSQTQIMARTNGGFFACDWSNWSIEPIAGNANRTPQVGTRLFRSILAELRHRNPSAVAAGVTEKNMVLARRSALLERLVIRGAYGAGLEVLARINADMSGAINFDVDNEDLRAD